MARKARPVEYDLVDDLDGKPLPEDTKTTKFTLGGTRYEIDLSAANAKKLDKALTDVRKFVEVARPTGAAPGRRRGRNSSRTSTSEASKDLGKVREWARANGHEVSDRGRIAQDIQDAYDAAH